MGQVAPSQVPPSHVDPSHVSPSQVSSHVQPSQVSSQVRPSQVPSHVPSHVYPSHVPSHVYSSQVPSHVYPSHVSWHVLSHVQPSQVPSHVYPSHVSWHVLSHVQPWHVPSHVYPEHVSWHVGSPHVPSHVYPSQVPSHVYPSHVSSHVLSHVHPSQVPSHVHPSQVCWHVSSHVASPTHVGAEAVCSAPYATCDVSGTSALLSRDAYSGLHATSPIRFPSRLLHRQNPKLRPTTTKKPRITPSAFFHTTLHLPVPLPYAAREPPCVRTSLTDSRCVEKPFHIFCGIAAPDRVPDPHAHIFCQRQPSDARAERGKQTIGYEWAKA